MAATLKHMGNLVNNMGYLINSDHVDNNSDHLVNNMDHVDNNMDHLVDDLIISIIILLDLNSLCQFGRCSHRLLKFFYDEKLWKLKILLQYQITTDIHITALQSYQFCLYAGRKKINGYDLFIINQWKELKANNRLQIDAGHRICHAQRQWKRLSIEEKNHWKVLASDLGRLRDICVMWNALSEKEREKFGIAAANYKKRLESQKETISIASKKKRRRKHNRLCVTVAQS